MQQVIINILPTDTITTVRDMFLIDFFEKVAQDSKLIGITELIPLLNYFQDKPIEGISYLHCQQDTILKSFNWFERDMYNRLLYEFPMVLNILLVGEGKISLCGESMLYIPQDSESSNFRFYFTSCTVEEATNFLTEIIEITKDATSYLLVDNILYIQHNINFQCCFCLTIYENKGSLLRNIGPAPDRHGYNPITGYFGTLSGATTLAMKAYPIDVDFKYIKLYKYNRYNILFHGFNKSFNHGDNIYTVDGGIKYDKGWTNNIFINSKDPKVQELTFDELIVHTNTSISMKFYKDSYKQAAKPNTWFKEDYVPYQVGITDDRYVALSGIRRKFNINDDIFKILCFYWLEAEVFNAKRRLLSLK